MVIMVRIPFRYKRFEQSTLATAFDKICHSPIRILIGLFLAPVFMAPGLIWKEVFPTEVVERLSNIASVIIMIFFFFGSLFWGMICDKFKWSEKIALWDIARQNGLKKVPAKLMIALVLVLVYLVTPFAYKATQTVIQISRDEQYNETMSALGKFEMKMEMEARADKIDFDDILSALGNSDRKRKTLSLAEYNPQALTAGATKMTAYDLTEQKYTTKYVPKEWLAEKVDEVGYVLFYENGHELAGYYGNIGSSSGVAYQRYCAVSIMDCAQQELVFSNTFYGGQPPYSVSSGSQQDQYGSEPDADEIMHWVDQAMQDLLSWK